jgi:putative endonuclease
MEPPIRGFLIMYAVYVLYSQRFRKIYIGQTESIARRLVEHNNGLLSTYTKRYKPWKIVYTEEYDTRAEALKREKQLKSQKGREFIWNVIKQK